MDDGGENEGATDPAESRVFDSVVSNLRKTYPKDKMQDISTSFCFICLLHLANERGLKIEVGESPGVEDEDQPEEGDNKVGDLWGLKVILLFRPPLSYCSGTDSFFIGLPRSNRHSFSVREGRADNTQLIYTLSQTHLPVFYRFVRLSILSVVLVPACFRISTYTYTL